MKHEPVAERLLSNDDRPATSWPEGRRRLAEAGTYWLATARPDGRPHVRPLLAVWLDDALYFVASQTSRKATHLARDARCAVTTEADGADLVLEGSASVVRDDATLQQVAELYLAKYAWPVIIRDGAFIADGAPTAGPPPYHVYALSLETAYGFGKSESFCPTRWRFS